MNSKRCIFFGYMKGIKRYTIWDPTVHKIIIDRDIVFNEDSFQRTIIFYEKKKILVEHDVSNDVELDSRVVDDEHGLETSHSLHEDS